LTAIFVVSADTPCFADETVKDEQRHGSAGGSASSIILYHKMTGLNRFFLLILCCLTGVLPAFAQWPSQDSLRTESILSKKDTIRLNPEAMESIRNGTFLNLGRPHTPMGSISSELPLVKDFSEYFESHDTVSRPFKLTDLPSYMVLRYYNPKMPPGSLKVSDDYYYFYLKNATRGLNNRKGYDFVHLLNTAFSPEYRRFLKNRKNATKLKHYNDLPDAELHRKQQEFLSTHPELRLPTNAAE
jgi:hypothetical protein